MRIQIDIEKHHLAYLTALIVVLIAGIAIATAPPNGHDVSQIDFDSPIPSLSVSGTAELGILRLEDTAGNGVFWDIQEVAPSNDLTFTYGTEKVRITAMGKVGIGTPAPHPIETHSWLTVSGSDPKAVTTTVINEGGGQVANYLLRRSNGVTNSRFGWYIPPGTEDALNLYHGDGAEGGVDPDINVISFKGDGKVNINGILTKYGSSRATLCYKFFPTLRTKWRRHTWTDADCSHGIPKTGAIFIGEARSSNGLHHLTECLITRGGVYTNPNAGSVTASIKCLYIQP